ncbi:hypothetical protein, partial [Fibrobacter sp. HC4]|uniref:hypothetical protein n=2 Tax=unclassified Fibrobacter TaxID=2634177 RepID=UPI0020192FF9
MAFLDGYAVGNADRKRIVGKGVLISQNCRFLQKNKEKSLKFFVDLLNLRDKIRRVPLPMLCRNNRNLTQTRVVPRFRSDKPSAEEEEKMAKEHFDRSKPHCNIGTIGHVDHGKT